LNFFLILAFLSRRFKLICSALCSPLFSARMLSQSMRSIQRELHSLALARFGPFLRQMDPIQLRGVKKHEPKDFYFAVGWILFACFYGIFGHQYSTIQSIDLPALVSAPYLFVHQMAPKVIWPIFRWGFTFNTCGALGVYAGLICTLPIRERFVFTITEQGSVRVGSIGQCSNLYVFFLILSLHKNWKRTILLRFSNFANPLSKRSSPHL